MLSSRWFQTVTQPAHPPYVVDAFWFREEEDGDVYWYNDISGAISMVGAEEEVQPRPRA